METRVNTSRGNVIVNAGKGWEDVLLTIGAGFYHLTADEATMLGFALLRAAETAQPANDAEIAEQCLLEMMEEDVGCTECGAPIGEAHDYRCPVKAEEAGR